MCVCVCVRACVCVALMNHILYVRYMYAYTPTRIHAPKEDTGTRAKASVSSKFCARIGLPVRVLAWVWRYMACGEGWKGGGGREGGASGEGMVICMS